MMEWLNALFWNQNITGLIIATLLLVGVIAILFLVFMFGKKRRV